MNSTISLSNPLGKTALYTCAARAYETKNRPISEALFNDPYAEVLSGEYGFGYIKAIAETFKYDIPLEIKVKYYADTVSVRTAYFDKVLEKALEIDKIKQIIILAVGGDCRPYRMNFPNDCKIFELDLPDVIEYRNKILKDLGAKCSCELITLGSDITNGDIWMKQLKERGFNDEKKSLFLLEGLLMYLKNEEIEALLKNISLLCASGSILAGDVLSDESLKSEKAKMFHETWSVWGSPMVSSCSYPEKLIEKFVFDCKVNVFGDQGANFGRFPNYPNELLEEGNPRHFYFSAIKK